jgi:hypothetical protein
VRHIRAAHRSNQSIRQVVVFARRDLNKWFFMRTQTKGPSAGPVLGLMLMHNTILDEALLQDCLF